MRLKDVGVIFSAIGTAFTSLYGGWDMALKVLVLFIAVDYITGVGRAVVNKELSSAVGLKGLFKKAMILIVLLVAVSIDKLIGGDGWIFRTMICYFFIANEGISILENAASIGLPVPEKLIDILKQLKDDGKKAIKKEI